VETKLKLITQKAKENRRARFTALAHHLSEENLKTCFYELKKGKAPGIDGVTLDEYEQGLSENLKDLVARMKAKAYRPKPVKRVFIDKEGGKKRPIGIPALEDKVVQLAMAKILNAVFEPDFLDSSFGFRPGRGCHQALTSLNMQISTKSVNYVVDLDIKSFFDNVDHKWLIKCLKQRIADPSFLRLITRFLKSGVIEDGKYLATDKGTPQGGNLSPILCNIYLHFVLDLWLERKLKLKAGGYLELVRYVDDAVICCEHQRDARMTIWELKQRLAKFGLQLNEDKTRIVRFGRLAGAAAKRAGIKPQTFDFLGFTHYQGIAGNGKFKVGRRTAKKRFNQKVKAIARWLNAHSGQFGHPFRSFRPPRSGATQDNLI